MDEIDTGLNFSTMTDMWKLVWETSKQLNVQVFATTHSDDCWKSLADIANLDHPSRELSLEFGLYQIIKCGEC